MRSSPRPLFALCIVLFAFVLAGCARTPPALPAAEPDPIRRLHAEIAAAISGPGVERGVWGIAVHSLARDEPLFQLNAQAMLVPASVSKLLSVASAAEAVGWDYRYETTLRATGPIVDGVLQGDLVVVGSGDPTLDGPAGDDLSVFVDALQAHGIRKIAGRVIGDDDSIQEPRPQLAWAWDDLGYTSGALFGALNLAENRLRVTIAPGPAPGDPTTLSVDPRAAYRPLINRSLTGPAGSARVLWPEQRPGEPALTIDGSIPVGAEPASLTVSAGNPTFWFASAFRQELLAAGIEVAGGPFDIDDVWPTPSRTAAMILHTHRSRPLADIVRPLLKDSINLYGEAVLRLNAAPDVLPTNDAALEGLRKRMNDWGIPDEGWQIIDGSGLSRRNTVASDVLVAVLRHMYDDSWSSPWMTALPVAGRDGTLAGRLRDTPAEGNLRAKTGTMSNIRSLAGYVRAADGEPLAFVIMVDNFEGPGAAATRAVDRIAVALASFRRP